MTNRDPNMPDFISKFLDYYNTVKHYHSLPGGIMKLKNDNERLDLELVGFFDKYQMKGISKTNRLHYCDFIKCSPKEEQQLRMRMKKIFPDDPEYKSKV